MKSAILVLFAMTTYAVLAPRAVHSDPGASLAAECNAIAWGQELFSSSDVPVKLKGIQARLIKRGTDAIAEVISALPDSLNLRRIASPVLARHPGDATRAALITLLSDKDTLAASSAAFYLGSVGGREVIDALVGAVSANNPSVQHNALNTLAQLGAADRCATKAVKLLESSGVGVTQSAASLLGELRGETNRKAALKAIERGLARLLETRTRAIMSETRDILRVRLGKKPEKK